MGRIRRKEYYHTKGHIDLFINERPSGFGPWPKRPNYKELVIAIEEDEGGSTHMYQGPSYTKELERDALLIDRGLYIKHNISQADRQMPISVIKMATDKVSLSIKKMTQKFARLNNEERITGALFSDIDMDEHLDGWRIKIYHQGFSSIIKEPQTGADLGIIVDVSNDESRVIKVVWFQAKRISRSDEAQSFQNLSGLFEQLEDMRRFTIESYGLAYTPAGVMVLALQADSKKLKVVERLEKFIGETLICEHGDRNPEAIANTLDCKHIVGVSITQDRN